MRRVRVADTAPEVAFRKALWHAGLRYLCHRQVLRCRPDIVLLRWRIAIFIDGDFWHGRDWPELQQQIKSNRDYWIPKIERNKQRDLEADAALEAAGWQVIRIWEHDIKHHFGTALYQVLKAVEAYVW